MEDLLRDFLAETAESLDAVDAELVRFEREPNNERILGEIFRVVHSIKGACGFLGLDRLGALTHAAEALLAEYRDGREVTRQGVSCLLTAVDRLKAIVRAMQGGGRQPAGHDRDLIAALRRLSAEGALAPGPAAAGTQSGQSAATAPGHVLPQHAPRVVRVNVDTLEHLMTVLGELVLTRNQLLEVAQRVGPGEFKVPLQRLASVTAQLQRGAMKTRMQPIGAAWHTLPRMLRDLIGELGKKIELEMIGGETEVDRQVLDLIKDPLIHMVRNSADHGLEDAATRAALGKPGTGRITLAARHDGGHIVVTISDDGRGLDADAIRTRAVELGLATEAEVAPLSERQIYKLIFRPGFSTAARVTSVSGRGVGLDVVRSNMELIGGSVEVDSVRGGGTIFTIRIPLTLAIVPALIVETRGRRYAIPQLAVAELVRIRPAGEHRVERIDTAPVLRLRGELLTVASLARLLRLEPEPAEQHQIMSGLVLVVQFAAQRFGLLVEAACGTEEIVVKPLSSVLRDIKLFSGNTILGDGGVVMILDPNGLARAVLGPAGAQEWPEGSGDARAAAAAAADMTALLVLRTGAGERKALPLSRIVRIEEIDPARIEQLRGRQVIQYGGDLVPLMALGGAMPAGVAASSGQAGERPILICGEGRRRVALLVDEIVDIVEARITQRGAGQCGLPPSAVIDGRATELVDVDTYLEAACAVAPTPGVAA